MYCRNCGNECRDGLKFCPKCGAPLNRERMQPETAVPVGPEIRTKRNTAAILLGVIAAALAVVLILQNLSILPSLGASETGSASSDVGYSTPEETARAFTEAIAANDLEGALSLFACNQMAENYDFNAGMEWYHTWNPGMQMPFSSEDTLYADINEKSLENSAAWQIGCMMFSREGKEEYMSGSLVSPENGDASGIVSDIQNACSLDNLSSFKLERMDYSNPERQLSDSAQTGWESQCEIYGADERVEYVILYSYNGDTYAGGMTLLRYGENWYIQFLSAPLAGQNAYGWLTLADEEEYLEMAGGQ